MRIAIKYGAVVIDEDGHVAGHDAGATLVRRLIRLFPNSIVIGPATRKCDGFDEMPLEFIDANDTVVINMDVLDSVSIWQTLVAHCEHPKIMNFVWWSTSDYSRRVQRAALALSCGLFPTFANSQHTATEVSEIVRSWTTQAIAEKAKIAYVNLGIRMEHRQERQETPIPVVLYPAIYLSDRKQPKLFCDVVEKVHKRTPIQVEARLHERSLINEIAMRMSRRDWMWVGPLTATREDYWQALARTTAFLATSQEESYGLEYVEALVAGAIGIFPDLPWAHALLPKDYPFFYKSAAGAEALLYRAVTEPEECRKELDAAAGGNFVEWLRAKHDDDQFEKEIALRVRDWFGE